MKELCFKDGIMMYYGNPAGYLVEGKAVLDSIFEKEEIISYLREKEKLAVEVRSGVYDRLAAGGGIEETGKENTERKVRIYQLKQGCPIMMRFVSLAEREKRGFGKPQADEYDLVYEKEVETFNLDAVWEQFNREPPVDFTGHALSISDVVGFSDEGESRFFYVEPMGFAEVSFEGEKQP